MHLSCKLVCLAILLVAAALVPIPAQAQGQDLIVQRLTFMSGQKSVSVERFDSPLKHLHAAVMLVHGAGGPEGGWRKSGMIEALTRAGYSVFAPHYFEAADADWDRSRAQQLFPVYMQALKDALIDIARQPDLEPKKGIGLVGFSLGAYLVLGVAATSNLPSTPKMPIRAVVELYGGLRDSATDVTAMPPVLIFDGAKDDTVPVSNAYELDQLLTKKKIPHQIHIYPDQGHGFNGDALVDSTKRTVSFLNSFLH